LYLLCGKIAAGKSTLARRLAGRPATRLISEDYWTSNLFSDDLRIIDDYGLFSALLPAAAMGPHIVDILRHGLSIVLDFLANTISNRNWMRSLITEANVVHELHLLDVGISKIVIILPQPCRAGERRRKRQVTRRRAGAT